LSLCFFLAYTGAIFVLVKLDAMVDIHTLSVADFKRTMKDNGLSDKNIEQWTELAIISIGNSFEDELADDIYANGPSSHWFKFTHANVLNLDFDDIAAPEGWKELSKCGQYILFDENMAHQIADFVEANKNATVWLVHCSAGVSRSGAVSKWLKDWLEHRHGIKANNVDGRYAYPNPYVLMILDRLFLSNFSG